MLTMSMLVTARPLLLAAVTMTARALLLVQVLPAVVAAAEAVDEAEDTGGVEAVQPALAT